MVGLSSFSVVVIIEGLLFGPLIGERGRFAPRFFPCVECEDFFTNPKKQLTFGFLLCMLRLRMSRLGTKMERMDGISHLHNC